MLNYQLSRDNFAHNRTIIVAAFRFIFVVANIPQPFDESKGGGGGGWGNREIHIHRGVLNLRTINN